MEAVIDGLCRAAVAAGHDVRLVSTDPRPGDAPPGVERIYLPRRGPRRWTLAGRLGPALHGADVVHVHGVDGLADQALAWRGGGRAAVVVSTHGGFLHTRRHAALKRLVLRSWTRWSLGRADAVCFVSEADAQAHAAARLDGVVLPNGIDAAHFGALERDPTPGRWLVLGRVDRHKGVASAVALLRHFPDVQLDVVGPLVSGPLHDALKEVADASGVADRVTFHGAVSADVRDAFLMRCELALFPSRFEGFGIGLAEALASGAPCVARSIPAHHAVGGGCADVLLVDLDAQDAAERVARFRSRLPAHSAAARAAAASWDWQAIWPQWEALYDRVRSARGEGAACASAS